MSNSTIKYKKNIKIPYHPYTITLSEEKNIVLKKMYEENSITDAINYSIIEGTIVNVDKNNVTVSTASKYDCNIPIVEFKDMKDIAIGTKIDLYIEQQENKKGEQIVSRKKAKKIKAWKKIEEAEKNGSILEGTIISRVKGGFVMDIDGIETFLPGSQVDIKPVQNFDVFLGKNIDVKVLKINHFNNNIIVSHKKLIEGAYEKQRQEIMNNIEKGQILEGTVKNIKKFGVFVDLGGVDGLLYLTDLSWNRITHPEEIVQLGDKIKVVVTDFDEEKKRISLGMKQLTPNPWDNLPENIVEGAKVKGKIVNIVDYGIFIEVLPNIEGLIHISEMTWSQHYQAQKFLESFKLGEEVEAIILTICKEEKKISLGIKQLKGNPWDAEKIRKKYPINSKHQGKVINIMDFGVFIALEEGVDGLLHVSDMSWTNKIKNPADIIKLNQEIEIMVLDVDVEKKKLSLGLKQLEQNPWDIFEDIFKINSTCKGNVTKMVDNGIVVELPYGLEGFILKKNYVPDSDKEIKIGDTIECKILEIARQNKKIMLSYNLKSLEKSKAKNDKKEKQEKKKEYNTLSNQSSKSTLGDLEALAAIKKQLDKEITNEENKT